MRLVLDRRHHLHERFHLAAGDAARHCLLEVGEVTVDAPGGRAPFGGRRDHERAAIRCADFACDQTAVRQPIEDARQRRALVREAAMELGDRRRRRGREQRQDVRFALRQAILTQIGQVEADPVCRSVDGWNQAQ